MNITRREMLQLSTLAAVAPRTTWAQISPTATTTSGKIRGYLDSGVNVFKGIPYGDDTSKTRFQPPAKPIPWTGIRDALTFGPQAPQPIHPRTGRSSFSPLDEENPTNSEDCLHLNVWTPGLRDRKRRPVLVYIHGGAYSSSSSNGPIYDGVRLAKRGDVVVVTLNHRLNLFGYMYLATLGGADYADSGNAGQLDLVLALEWVRDNIAEFGGDPSRVIIFGQSGGGAKCATLMAMPAAKGLFHRVVTMSGQQLTATVPEHATATAEAVLSDLGLAHENLDDIGTLAEMEGASGEKGSLGRVRPSWTGPKYLPACMAATSFSMGTFLGSRMILGNTHDETRLLIGSSSPALFELSWPDLPAHHDLEHNLPRSERPPRRRTQTNSPGPLPPTRHLASSPQHRVPHPSQFHREGWGIRATREPLSSPLRRTPMPLSPSTHPKSCTPFSCQVPIIITRVQSIT